jgi:CBS domain-containing protein
MSAASITVTVRDAMHAGVISTPVTSSVGEIAATLADHRIHCALVAGVGARGWGIVSDLDLMRAVAAGRHDLTAGQLASMEAVTVGPDADIAEAAQLMAEHEVSHLLVMSGHDDPPVGVLSTFDVARAIRDR